VDLPLLMFLTVTAGAGTGFYLLSYLLFPDASRIRRRMSEEFQSDKRNKIQSPLFKNLDRLSLDIPSGGMSDLGMVEMAGNHAPRRLDFTARLREKLDQAGLDWTVHRLYLLMGILGGTLCGLGVVVEGPTLAVLGLAAGVALPTWYVHNRAKARKDKLLHQLPDAFDLMASILRSGSSVPQALQAVAESMDPPVSGELTRCQKQLNLGLQAEITFQDMAQRSGIVEMRIFVMALLIQRQVGGNLSMVLERLAVLIRARLKLKKQVHTLTAEGRLQAMTLLVLPFVMFGAMMVINPEYAMTLFKQVPLLIATGVMMLVGALWIRRIVQFDV
jgi:tight adherence protein B